MLRISLLHSIACILLIAGTCTGQSSFSPPGKIYADPCTQWGNYDYGMGSATLVPGSFQEFFVAASGSFFIYDGTTCLAKYNFTLASNGTTTFSLLAQYLSGSLTPFPGASNIWRPTEFTDFVSLIHNQLPAIKAIGTGGYEVNLTIQILQFLGSTTNTSTGSGGVNEYFEAFSATYIIDEGGSNNE